MPGPVPKHSSERRRRNKESAVETVASFGDVAVPEADEMWHPIAHRWYESLRTSGQSRFYEPSDWAQAFYVAEAMSRNLSTDRFSAQLFASVLSAMTELLTTEGARRRVRLEVEREKAGDESAPVMVLDDFRAL